MNRLARLRRPTAAAASERGLTLIEVLVGMIIMTVVTAAIAGFVGTAVQSKLIGSTRSADTETARATLAWMVDRLRNAGLNLEPGGQAQVRCKDRVVALDPNLLPTGHSMYVSGELLKTDTVAGNEDVTVGYYLAPDAETGNHVVMEYRQPCASAGASIERFSARLSNPRLNVTDLTFEYFDVGGTAITTLTVTSEIRKIAAIRISLTVQGTEGASGTQSQTLTRSVLLWNPEPNANHWVNANESY